MDGLESPIVEFVPSTYQQRARDRIKTWIAATKTTQAAVGERIGKNQEWMSRYLAGKFDADLETLAAIATVFDLTLIALLDLPRDPQEGRLVELFRALHTRNRARLLDFLEDQIHPPKSR